MKDAQARMTPTGQRPIVHNVSDVSLQLYTAASDSPSASPAMMTRNPSSESRPAVNAISSARPYFRTAGRSRSMP